MATAKQLAALKKARAAKKAKGTGRKKGDPSKTRPGRQDFVTHKGDKYYDEDGKRMKKYPGQRKPRARPFFEAKVRQPYKF
jgi:hypothetical protein